MRRYLLFGILAVSCTAFLHNPLVWAQSGEKKALTAEEAADAQKKLEDAQKKLKKAVKNVPKIDNAGSITGVVTCARMRNNADAIVFIETVGDNKFPPAAEHAIIDQLNLTFVPHVIAVQKGTTIDFPNSDAVRHNVFSPPKSPLQFNLGTYPQGVIKEVLFDVAGETPLNCNVHAEMSCFAVALENPYFAVTDRDGKYVIEDVPPGTYVVKTWHEKLSEVSQEITVEAGKASTANFELKKRKT